MRFIAAFMSFALLASPALAARVDVPSLPKAAYADTEAVTNVAFDAARGEGHFLDLLWGGFPGADAPSVGTDKEEWSKAM